MPRQLTFWPDTQRPKPAQPPWEDLDEGRRDALVVALAKLIGKKAHLASPEPNAEDDHER